LGAVRQIRQALAFQRKQTLHPFNRVVPRLERNPPLAGDPVGTILAFPSASFRCDAMPHFTVAARKGYIKRHHFEAPALCSVIHFWIDLCNLITY
jgi:hypothetical protein